MTAQLTDHHGAIDPKAFDADNPVRPLADPGLAVTLAEQRLWGPSSYVPRVGNRRMAAVGYSDSEGAMITDHTEYGVKVYEYVPH